MLTKPVSRAAFILAKAISQMAPLLFATTLGGGVFLVATWALFGSVDIAAVLMALALWTCIAALVVSLISFRRREI